MKLRLDLLEIDCGRNNNLHSGCSRIGNSHLGSGNCLRSCNWADCCIGSGNLVVRLVSDKRESSIPKLTSVVMHVVVAGAVLFGQRGWISTWANAEAVKVRRVKKVFMMGG